MTIQTIKQRSEIISHIRDFFINRDYLTLETPLLSPSLIPESAIEVFKTEHVHPFKKNKESYLIPSPEVWLKRFISEHKVNIFEISKCFRNSEQSGKQHNPEFTMIEYYTMGYTHMDSLNLTIELLSSLNTTFEYSKLPKENLILTMDQAFIKYAGFSLEKNNTVERLHIKAKELGIHTDKSDCWETAFNRIFIDRVEPYLPKDKILFLTDFPKQIKTLAKDIPNTPWSQRWELYINGIECGNCYSEETDRGKVEDYFLDEAKEKERSIINHNIDRTYPDIFKDFPKCSGAAIGIDRLIMGILGIEDIQGVILFPYHDTI